jgi:CRISPR system Cascade subunit CasB
MKEMHPFVQRLYDLAAREDRAALAELRRSFANPLAALPYVVPFLRRDASRREEDAFVLVAGLFAIHPMRGNLSLARAMRICAERSDSVSLRFLALLDSDAEDLATHLRHGVTLVRSMELALDYDDLLQTVRWWSSEDRSRQRRWAREFWGTADTNEETAT